MGNGYCLTDTIYALSSGPGKGGVAVIRISGNRVRAVLKQMVGLDDPTPRYAYFKAIRKGRDILDRSLILFFAGPASFTGEDVAEFHVHGGQAVIHSILEALGEIEGCRPAERGEFSRRAVINGKMDLTQAEGMADLINAQTERQQAQAMAQMQGNLKNLYDGWRQDLTHHMAYLEAFIDFPEEEIPPEKMTRIDSDIIGLAERIRNHLDDHRAGERLRDGFRIALIGAPNVGKSSLINALTHRDVAIVSQVAGTTRDVVEAYLDVAGFPVILSDTAGLRERAESIEAEGIRRAVRTAESADLILYIRDIRQAETPADLPQKLRDKTVLNIWNKADLSAARPDGIVVSAVTGDGIQNLWDNIKGVLVRDFGDGSTGLITRDRYRVALKECLDFLNRAKETAPLELKAENLRMAARSLGRITGQIETEELLDVIFRDFCIGK